MKKGVKEIDSFKCEFPSRSVNEGFARNTVAAFISGFDPTLSDVCDIKTAVSEGVTNCIVHAYQNGSGKIYLSGRYFEDGTLELKIRDKGKGIEDVKLAMEPLYTTDKSGERGGMGFAVMKAFTDVLKVRSKPERGTVLTLIKRLSRKDDDR